VAAHSSNAAPSAGLHALGDPIHDAHELGREAIPVVFPQRNFVSVGAHLASQLRFSQQLQDRVSGFQDHQSTGAGGVRPPRPPQSAGASRSGAPSTDSGVGTQNHDGPGPTQLACVRGGNEAATKHLHDIGISNIVDVRTAVVKKASSDRMRSPGPIPRRGFLVAKRRSAGVLPVTAVPIRWPGAQVYDIGLYALPERSQYAACRIVEPIRAHDDHR